MLGPVRVDGGGEVDHLGTGRAARVVSCLAAEHGTVVSADRLVDAVWGIPASSRARNALQVEIGRLRRRLAPVGRVAIETVGDGYRLSTDCGGLDLEAFEDSVRGARGDLRSGALERARRRIEAALALWGEPFGGIADELGLDGVAAGLRELRLEADEVASRIELAAPGRPDVVRLRRLVDEAPFREARWVDLVHGLYRSGRQVEALHACREVAEMFREELGLLPGHELRALEERVLLHDPALSEPPAPIDRRRGRRAPHFPEPTVGRSDELAELGSLVESHRVVSVVGLAGIGKTRLAADLTRSICSRFRDGAAFADLSTISDVHAVEHVVWNALGEEQPGADEVATSACDRHLLLVLDGVDAVAAGVRPVVDELVAACEHVHVVVTSRRAVGIRGEVTYRVRPLPVATAAELFVQAARRAGPDLRQDGRHAAEVERISRAVGGVPLLVEIAAAQLATTPLDRIAQTLRERFGGLDGEGDVTATVLGWGIDLISTDERSVGAALSVFRDGWSQEAAEAVLDELGLERSAVSGLAARSLINVDATTGRGTMLQPVADALRARAPDVAYRAAAIHARHFADMAQRELHRISSYDHRVSLDLLDRDEHNIAAALEWSIEHRDARGLRALPTLGVHLWRRQRLAEGRRWFDRIEAAFDPLAEHHPLSALYSAHLAMWGSRPDLAEARLDAAEEHVRASGDPALIGRLLHSRGNIAGWGRGQPAASLEWFSAAQDVLAPVRDPFAVVSAVSEGYMAVRCGRRDVVDAVLSSLAADGDVRALTGSVGIDMIGGVRALYDGDVELADRLLEDACDGLERLGVGVLKGPGLAPLVWAAVLRGRHADARARAVEAHRFADEHGGRWRIGDACAAFGLVELAEGRVEAARAWFGRGVRAGAEAPEVDVLAWSAAGLIEVGVWLDEERRRSAAARVKGLLDANSIVAPPGFERFFGRTLGAAGRSGTVPDLLISLREVFDGV